MYGQIGDWLRFDLADLNNVSGLSEIVVNLIFDFLNYIIFVIWLAICDTFFE
jgi:hypothetical protein